MFHSYLKQLPTVQLVHDFFHSMSLVFICGRCILKIVMKMGKWGAVPVNVSARSTWSSSHRTHSGAFLGIDLTPLTPHFSGNLLCDPWPHHWTSDWVSPSHRHCLILGEFGMLQNGQHIFAWEPLHMPTQRILGYKTFQARYFQMQTSCLLPSFSRCVTSIERLRLGVPAVLWGCGPQAPLGHYWMWANLCRLVQEFEGRWLEGYGRGLEGLIQGGPAPHVIC